MWGSEFTTKAASLQGGFSRNRAQLLCMRASAELLSCYSRSRVIHKALDHSFQAVVRGGARCASQVLDRGAQVDVHGATHILYRGVEAVTRGAARCALNVHGHDTMTDAFGRSFAVLSTQVSAAGLRLRLVVPRPMPASVASRFCGRR